MPKIAVIIFPGTNCELETIRACTRSGMKADLFRWNEDRKKLKNYDGFILPGGFSYEDRGRSGIIAAKDPIMNGIRKEAEKGKPVLGLCNGAQILVESALIPELNPSELEMSITWSTRIKDGELLGIGFHNDWIYIRSDSNKKRSVFNNFGKDVVMRIPIAHGEGRFTTRNKKILETLIQNDQTLFRYCDKDGKIEDNFPVNPNGALYNMAGVCNSAGNVLALMPHPERTIVGQPIFDSISEFLNGKFILSIPKKTDLIESKVKDKILKNQNPGDIVIKVALKITDNTERTIENTIKKNGFKDLHLKRHNFFSFNISDKKNALAIAKRSIETGEILNLNKETPLVEIMDKKYSCDADNGLQEKIPAKNKTIDLCVIDHSNFEGEKIMEKLSQYFREGELLSAEKGILWSVKLKNTHHMEKLVKSHIFHNPHAMKIVDITK